MAATRTRPASADRFAARAIPEELQRALDLACARIAPAWPLDRLIAVNPWWGFVDQPIEAAAAELAALGGVRLTMPREWFRARLADGTLTDARLARALALQGSTRTVAEVRAALDAETPDLPVGPLMTDVVDATRETVHHTAWRDFVVEHVSHACGAWFGAGQATWSAEHGEGLYGLWLDMTAQDAGVRLLMGVRGFRHAVADLPRDHRHLIAHALEELAVPPSQRAAYCTALLLSVSGWASACAFQRWEARLAGRDDDLIVQLLAVRLAWELLLFRTSGAPSLAARWADARRGWADLAPAIADVQELDWVLQRALELAYQESLARQLASARVAGAATAARPAVQAVFCIDVRSEVLRRALEAVRDDVQTLGFAGFFGLPLAYRAADGVTRPQLPGLLAPALGAVDVGPGAEARQAQRQASATIADAWAGFTRAPASTFTAVEATGLGAALSLVRRSLAPAAPPHDPLRTELATGETALAPQLASLAPDGASPDVAARAQLAANVLRGMSLTRDFAPLVALIGHGATTCNNPQAAGLACGACGGQSGEVNARVLAVLLNDRAVRDALRGHGIIIPEQTHVVAGLHDTVTDEVTLYEREAVPATHGASVAAFAAALAQAGTRARRERAPRLGLASIAEQPERLLATLRRRAADWSEVRPEWGLARNAAFIVAPRERTRGLHLDGRTFLHEYRWAEDTGFAVLELILTAPMVVTNWINLQYHASTVDPVRYGSGDKVLHNVVGGNIGVFEGAGGDLRIGLARQSVHDGSDWVHEPLRLTVCVEAPAAAIDGILARHPVVRQLVEHGWLHLARIEPADGRLVSRTRSGWAEEAIA
jgi:uncharacterized protein YbcC (UPF0753/DUF2309 family)